MEAVPPWVHAGGIDRADAGDVDAVAGATHRWIASAGDLRAFEEYPAKAAAVVGDHVRGGGDALAACRVLTSLNDAVTVRLIRFAEADLGPPPCRYAWLALGSGGRMEQSLYTDQDNAIAYAGPADPYFAALGARVVDGLATAGLRRCPGGYMADRWRLALPAWREMFNGWIDHPEPQALVEAEVFLDFRPVYGELSTDPLDATLLRGGRSPRFQVGMARAAVRFDPPRGLALRRFAARLRGRDHEVDLKRGGLATVVLLARLYALAGGSPARSTVERLAAAEAAGTLTHDGAAALTDAYRFLTDLRLRAQLRAAAAGAAATNRVPLGELSAPERARLVRTIRAVRLIQRATAVRFHTDTVL